ncbi:Ribonuclease III domain containing protein [Parasponia andersonii]|uniref:Ribonuclease III domain containing protein n=1 Tax=Parasponia andersonii TaxID=3476 RepID=A0A2P5BH70_PARAD|nr:Ribonuclease III domain containing protein [Parasponia andersonii]
MQTLSVASSSSVSLGLRLRLRASWDTQQMLSYNPNAPKNPNKTPTSTASKNLPPTVTLTASTARMVESISELLKRPPPPPQGETNKRNELYLGYERWLPSPPKVKKPRSVYNAASLAYLGDCIYELYARRHFLFPPLNIEEFNDRVTAVVRCEAQDALLQKLLSDNYLSEQERDVLRWGKNVGSARTRTKKRVGAAVYNRASSLETLIGYLYLTNTKRLDEIMVKVGFSTDSSMPLILEESNGKSTIVCEEGIEPSIS